MSQLLFVTHQEARGETEWTGLQTSYPTGTIITQEPWGFLSLSDT